MKRNDESLLDFRDDLAHVSEAEHVIMDSLYNDIMELKDEMEKVHETAEAQADELAVSGEAIPLSLKELMEQRTSVRSIDSVPQYNQIDHLSGRTPMERFSLSAAASIRDFVQKSDDVKEKFKKLLEYFGEDEKMPSNEFFGTMKRFVKEFGGAAEQVLKEEKKKVSDVVFQTKLLIQNT